MTSCTRKERRTARSKNRLRLNRQNHRTQNSEVRTRRTELHDTGRQRISETESVSERSRCGAVISLTHTTAAGGAATHCAEWLCAASLYQHALSVLSCSACGTSCAQRQRGSADLAGPLNHPEPMVRGQSLARAQWDPHVIVGPTRDQILIIATQLR